MKFEKFSLKGKTELPENVQFVEIVRDRYWVVDDEDNAILYRNYSPQYNSDVRIAEKLSKIYEGTKVKFFPVIYLEVDIKGDFNIIYK